MSLWGIKKHEIWLDFKYTCGLKISVLLVEMKAQIVEIRAQIWKGKCMSNESAVSIIAYAEKLEPVFDHAVETGSDDELFASGYLRGHFDLIVAQCDLAGEHNPEQFWAQLDAALERSKEELNPQDRAHVQNMLTRLKYAG